MSVSHLPREIAPGGPNPAEPGSALTHQHGRAALKSAWPNRLHSVDLPIPGGPYSNTRRADLNTVSMISAAEQGKAGVSWREAKSFFWGEKLDSICVVYTNQELVFTRTAKNDGIGWK